MLFRSAQGDQDSNPGGSCKHLNILRKAAGSYSKAFHTALAQNAFRHQSLESPGNSKRDAQAQALREKQWMRLRFQLPCIQLLLEQTGCSNPDPLSNRVPHLQTTAHANTRAFTCLYGSHSDTLHPPTNRQHLVHQVTWFTSVQTQMPSPPTAA